MKFHLTRTSVRSSLGLMNHAPDTKPVTKTQDQILSATLLLFTKKGYFNTSIHDIVRESGISVGSVYHHFSDKEGVASALYNNLLERMNAELANIMKLHTSAHDRCRAVIGLLFDITEQEPEVMEFMLYTKHRDFLPDEIPVCSSKPFELMREIVAQGMASGEIRTMDVMVASTCLYGGPIRMITARLDGQLPKQLSTYMDEIWTCSWRAVAKD